MKVIVAVLSVLLLAGCAEGGFGYKSVSQWQQTGSVTLTYAGSYNLDYRDSANVLRTLSACHGSLSNPLSSVKAGMVVDIKFRIRNEYDTIYDPCAEIDNVKVISSFGMAK